MIAWLITRSVVKPLSGLKERMASLSAGQLDAPVADADRTDEIGQMARTVQVFRDAMIETNRLREQQAETEQRQAQARKADMNRLADQFESEVGEIIKLVSVAAGQLEASSKTLSKTADTVEKVSATGLERVRRGLLERAFGGRGQRGARLLGRRNQPPGRRLRPYRRRGGRAGAEDRRAHQPAVAGGSADRRRRRSHSDRSPDRPICWR